MFSTLLHSQPPVGFGRFLTKLGGLIAFGLLVWAGLAAAVAWQHDRHSFARPIQVASRPATEIAAQDRASASALLPGPSDKGDR